MDVTSLPDAATFLSMAAPVLGGDTAANNLPIGIAQQLVDRPETYAEAFFWVAADSGRVVGAAMRTPPYLAIIADPLRRCDRRLRRDPRLGTAGPARRHGERAVGEPLRRRVDRRDRRAVAARRRSGRLCADDGAAPPPRGRRGTRPTTIVRCSGGGWARSPPNCRRCRATTATWSEGSTPKIGDGAAGGFTIWEVEGRPVSLTGWMPIPRRPRRPRTRLPRSVGVATPRTSWPR